MGFFNAKNQGAAAPAKVDKRNRTLRSVSMVSAVIFIAIILVFNILFDSILGDKLKWDWSFGDLYTTGEITRELLGDLENDVQITGLYEKGTMGNYTRIEQLLEEYDAYGKDRVTLRYVDMDLDPNIGRDIDPTGIHEFDPGTYVIKNMDNGRYRIVEQEDLFSIDQETYYYSGEIRITGLTAESAFSGGIKYVTADYTPTVYSLQGHGEMNLEAMTSLVNILENYNNVVLNSSLDLSIKPVIPEDCELILILNPKEDITVDEQRILQDYLEKGGDMMFVTEYSTTGFPRMNEILAQYNIEITNDRVREESVDFRFNEQPYVFRVEWPAGSLFDVSSTQLLASNARNIRIIANAKEWVKVESTIQTSKNAVVEDKGAQDNVSVPGVQTIGAICENTGWMSSNVSESSKVIVFGSVEMFADTVLQYYNTYNDELFYYAVNWATDIQDTNLFISEKPLPSYILQKGTQTGYIFASAVTLAVIPAILLVIGMLVYRRRKNL